MNLVIFGLTLSSSWGNGHATLWRGLLTALARRGHQVVFYEKDVSYYAENRDGWQLPQNVRLRVYDNFPGIRAEAARELAEADVAVVTSYCPDGPLASDLVCASPVELKVFYDLDTPVTLRSLQLGITLDYLPRSGLCDFDLVLSFTGGRALDELSSRLGARRVAPLFGWVDPLAHCPVQPDDIFRSQLSYLGTYAADRQPALEELFLKSALCQPHQRFLIGGSLYPDSFPWRPNIYYVQHLPPSLHATFFCSGRATLNVTRRSMAEYGFCPSGRLFEAAACGVPILSDVWEGLDQFFSLGSEILPVRNAEEVLAALSLSDCELRAVAAAAQERALSTHSALARAVELEGLLQSATYTATSPAVVLK